MRFALTDGPLPFHMRGALGEQ
eukprot:COSAG06_NODE_10984_length_1585_cov_9.677553_1_plen_21_part_10